MATDGPGGRIPPQGRPPSAPGVGRNAKRHDLERPKTPGLHGSDLQKGDVQALEQGQRIQPIKRTQPPARAGQPRPARPPGRGTNPPSPSGMPVPDPIEFARQRISGTLQGQPGNGRATLDFSSFAPLVRRLAATPNAGGTLTRAYIERLRDLSRNPTAPAPAVLDLSQLDEAVFEVIRASRPPERGINPPRRD